MHFTFGKTLFTGKVTYGIAGFLNEQGFITGNPDHRWQLFPKLGEELFGFDQHGPSF